MIFAFASLCLMAAVAVSQPIGRTHFFVQEGHEKCFLEDVAEGVPLTVLYHHYENPGVACSIIYKDPKGRSVFNREVTHQTSEGKVTYLAKMSGEHQICISCESSQWFATSQLKWSLSIDMGDNEINLADIAKSHHIEGLESALELVKGRLSVLTAENDYERTQEVTFRDTSEAMNKRIVIVSILQIFVMVLTTVLSIIHLSRYFHSQKLY